MHMCVARVAGWVGEEEKHTYCCYAYRLYFLTCNMYKSNLRHIHDPVLSSLKMKGIYSLFFVVFFCVLAITFIVLIETCSSVDYVRSK
jgi:hypothetical protein